MRRTPSKCRWVMSLSPRCGQGPPLSRPPLRPRRVCLARAALTQRGVRQEEYPAWVRECDQDFKDKKCTLTHEGRTKDKWRAFVGRLESSSANPFRKAARYRCSACEAAARKRGRSKKLNHNYGALPITALVETEGCTCHTEIRSMLPNLDVKELQSIAGRVGAVRRTHRLPHRPGHAIRLDWIVLDQFG